MNIYDNPAFEEEEDHEILRTFIGQLKIRRDKLNLIIQALQLLDEGETPKNVKRFNKLTTKVFNQHVAQGELFLCGILIRHNETRSNMNRLLEILADDFRVTTEVPTNGASGA
jgi:hypothetical protein